MKLIEILKKIFKKTLTKSRFPIFKILNFFSLKCQFLSFKLRIKRIKNHQLLMLDNCQFQRYKLSNDFEDFVSKIYFIVKNDKLEIYILEKFFFLLNFSNRRNFYLRFVKDYITNVYLDFNNLPNLFPFMVTPFILVGDYKMADKIIFILRKKKDKFYGRYLKLYGERTYLTAIGHLCLFAYYLKARDINFLGYDESSFLYDKEKISNNLFFELILSKAKKLNVTIRSTNKSYDYLSNEDHEMELWPCKEQKKYLFAREMQGIVEEKWREIMGRDNFFEVPENVILKAKEIINNKNFNSEKWFVGIHLRTSNDDRKLRNANLENIFQICNQIENEGGAIIFTGTNNFMNFNNKKNIIFINELNITKKENEILQLYVWFKAAFFIGNQSGGTHPPSLFGTPTIWVDVHPTVQARPPSKLDVVIPKRVFNLKNKKYLTFNEANSYEHYRCQTESEFLANFSGYDIQPSDYKIINKVLHHYIQKFGTKKIDKNNNFPIHNEFVPQEKGAYYAI